MTQSSPSRIARMVNPRVRSGAINTAMLAFSGLGALAYATMPTAASDPLQFGLHGLAVIGTVATGIKAGRLLLKDYRLRRDLALSQTTGSDFG